MKYPCKCGKSYPTAKKFSDHAHTECKLGVVPWGNVTVKLTVN